MAKMSLDQRLAECVDRSGGPDTCWPWTAGRSGGYGVVWCDGGNRHAHTVVLEREMGEVAAGRLALHSCDNPPCCNPRHLRWGTDQDNSDDRVSRGRARAPRGEDHHKAQLTDEDVRAACEQYVPGHGAIAALAREFGVSHGAMSHVIHGRSWRA